MAIVWLDETTYPAIRAALAADLTASVLPDSVIALPIYTTVAEMAIQALDPLWASRDDNENAILQLAAIYWCASLIAPALPRLLKESIGQGDYSYQADLLPVKDLIALLRANATALANQVTAGSPDVRPTLFTTAPGLRVRDAGYPVPVPAGSRILGVG